MAQSKLLLTPTAKIVADRRVEQIAGGLDAPGPSLADIQNASPFLRLLRRKETSGAFGGAAIWYALEDTNAVKLHSAGFSVTSLRNGRRSRGRQCSARQY